MVQAGVLTIYPGRYLLIGLAVVVLLAAFFAGQHDSPDEMAYAEFCVRSVTRAVGAFRAIASALSLLLMGYAKVSVERAALLGAAMLGGVHLVSRDWGPAMDIGMIFAALLLSNLLPWTASGPDRRLGKRTVT